MADCKNDCSGGCSTTCDGGCKGDCGGACSDDCTSTCRGTCEGSCKGTCCTGCTNACVSDCKSTCNDACKGNCFETCNTSCYDTCKGKCKGYCATICQTYCETKQIFTENLNIANAIGKPAFSWSNEVAEDEIIQITASEWNTLKGYIKTATQYCGGTAPTGADASRDPSSDDNLISAAKYNDLANGLGLSNVTANETLISASLIDKLRTTYNSRQIKNTLPAGEYPLTGNQNNCCQKGQTCMADGELLDHQEKTEKCADQTVSSCGNQEPGS